MLPTLQNRPIIRNYILTVASAILTGVIIADQYYNPARIAQQERLNIYGPYVRVGFVDYSQRTFSR